MHDYYRWQNDLRGLYRLPVAAEFGFRTPQGIALSKMQAANVDWGAPRIHRELLKLGIDVSQATVSEYILRSNKPPSQTWQTFLNNGEYNCVAQGRWSASSLYENGGVRTISLSEQKFSTI